ncbi:MAG: antitoxin VapB family protein [archaeon]|nr:antitoxin VapB family protein [archaeon]MCP8320831.1 antitoxin VapB family protein [archaeon]
MTRVVSLSNKAYKMLKERKREGESFSEVIMKLIEGEKRVSLTTFAGKWNGDDIDKVFDMIKKERLLSATREITV